jgi:CBS domain-containing protein
MSIEQYMTHHVIMVSEGDSLYEAAQLMKQKNVGAVVVVKNKDTDPTPIDMLTDRDIVIRLLAEDASFKQMTVKQVATRDVLTVQQNHGVQETIQALTAKGVRRAPVVDTHNKLIGMVTVDDLLLVIIEELHCLSGLIKKQIA